MPDVRLQRLSADSAAVFAAAALCAFPLYIDRFSNLGVVKFSAGCTLFLLFTLWLAACAAIGARPAGGRFAGRQDAGLWALAACVGGTALSTLFSLDRTASLWGLRGYYGGAVLVLYSAAGYLAVRAFADTADTGGLLLGMGTAAAVIAALYALNLLGFDPLGAYAGIAEKDRVQFFSTLGQLDFNSGGLALLLPPAAVLFVTAPTPRRALAPGLLAAAGMLGLAVVDADGLLLGLGAALLLLVCRQGFTARELGRLALLGAALGGWTALTAVLRRRFDVHLPVPLPGRPGMWALLPAALCLAVWALLRRCPDLPLHRPARALAAVLGAGLALVLLAVNLLPAADLPAALQNYLRFGPDWGNSRGLVWGAVWQKWLAAPLWRKLLGFGPGMTYDVLDPGPDSPLRVFFAAHNEYLELLLTAGLAGLTAWLAFAAAHLRAALGKLSRPGVLPVTAALVSYLAQAAVSIRVSILFPLVMLLFGWLAALCAPEPKTFTPPGKRKKAAKAAPAPSPAKRWAGIAVSAAAAMFVSGAVGRVLFGFLF